MRWLCVWVFVFGTSCTSIAQYGRYGAFLTENLKVSPDKAIVAVPGKTYEGESCTGLFFVPIGDGYHHMERAVTSALKSGNAPTHIIGMADVELSHQVHWYFLYLKSCWVVKGIGAMQIDTAAHSLQSENGAPTR